MTGWDSDAYDREIKAERAAARKAVGSINKATTLRLGGDGRERATDEELARRKQAEKAIARLMRSQQTTERGQ